MQAWDTFQFSNLQMLFFVNLHFSNYFLLTSAKDFMLETCLRSKTYKVLRHKFLCLWKNVISSLNSCVIENIVKRSKPSSITLNLNMKKFHFPSKVRKKFYYINVKRPAAFHQTISDITILTHEKTLLHFSLNKTEVLIRY